LVVEFLPAIAFPPAKPWQAGAKEGVMRLFEGFIVKRRLFWAKK